MELDFVAWLQERLPNHPRLQLGIGDDAALIDSTADSIVTTADLLIDGVHFRIEEHSPERIGRKALAVNLSDIAAMAAKPTAAIVSLALPRGGACGLSPPELAKRLLEGMLPLAEQFDCPIAGGDTNLGPGPLVISITALGTPTKRGVLRRDGAQPGDKILVTGSLGGSLTAKHLDFQPRIDEALLLHERFGLTAGMDITDGLSVDLARLAAASGVGAIVNEAALPIADAAHAMAQHSGRLPLEHALHDGEDFELLFTTSPDEAKRLIAEQPIDCGVTLIGEVTAEAELLLHDKTNAVKDAVKKLEPRGYEHG